MTKVRSVWRNSRGSTGRREQRGARASIVGLCRGARNTTPKPTQRDLFDRNVSMDEFARRHRQGKEATRRAGREACGLLAVRRGRGSAPFALG
jgi:hypothetical protein